MNQSFQPVLLGLLSILAVNVHSEPSSSSDAPALLVSEEAFVSVGDAPVLSLDRWPVVGAARLRVLFWDVYDSTLHTPSGRWQGEPPYQLALRYLRNIGREQLVEETEKAWRQQGRENPDQALWLQQLTLMWPDVAAGDQLVFGVDAQGENAFWFNGRLIGSVLDPAFSALFGGIWLDQDSPRPALRAQLVGAHPEEGEVLRTTGSAGD